MSRPSPVDLLSERRSDVCQLCPNRQSFALYKVKSSVRAALSSRWRRWQNFRFLCLEAKSPAGWFSTTVMPVLETESSPKEARVIRPDGNSPRRRPHHQHHLESPSWRRLLDKSLLTECQWQHEGLYYLLSASEEAWIDHHQLLISWVLKESKSGRFDPEEDPFWCGHQSLIGNNSIITNPTCSWFWFLISYNSIMSFPEPNKSIKMRKIDKRENCWNMSVYQDDFSSGWSFLQFVVKPRLSFSLKVSFLLSPVGALRAAQVRSCSMGGLGLTWVNWGEPAWVCRTGRRLLLLLSRLVLVSATWPSLIWMKTAFIVPTTNTNIKKSKTSGD